MSPVPPGFSFLITLSDMCSYCLEAVRNRERKKETFKLFFVSSLNDKSFHEPLREEQLVLHLCTIILWGTFNYISFSPTAKHVFSLFANKQLKISCCAGAGTEIKVHRSKLMPLYLNKHHCWHNLEQFWGCSSVEQRPDCPTALPGTGITFPLLPLGGIRGICQAPGVSQA